MPTLKREKTRQHLPGFLKQDYLRQINEDPIIFAPWLVVEGTVEEAEDSREEVEGRKSNNAAVFYENGQVLCIKNTKRRALSSP